jgi:hypothetical protein
MLNLYQNNTAARNQTAIRDMVNLEAYFELCKELFLFMLSFRRGAKLCNTKVHERTCELLRYHNLG